MLKQNAELRKLVTQQKNKIAQQERRIEELEKQLSHPATNYEKIRAKERAKKLEKDSFDRFEMPSISKFF